MRVIPPEMAEEGVCNGSFFKNMYFFVLYGIFLWELLTLRLFSAIIAEVILYFLSSGKTFDFPDLEEQNNGMDFLKRSA